MSMYSNRELQGTEVFKVAERHAARVCNSPLPSPFPEITGLEDDSERKPASNDTVRREIDRLARQMGRMGEELKKLRDSL